MNLSMIMIKGERTKKEIKKIGRGLQINLMRNQIEKIEIVKKRKKGREVETQKEREITIIIRNKKIIEERKRGREARKD